MQEQSVSPAEGSTEGMVGLLGKDELPVIEDCLSSVILHVHVAFFPRFYMVCTVSCCPHTCSGLELTKS